MLEWKCAIMALCSVATGLLLASMTAIWPVEASEVRVALVIGNNKYAAVSQLTNPARDARLVASTFSSLGFQTVQLANDLSRSDFIGALRQFERESETADWAIIYYAGHGIEINGTNYLVPIDAQLRTDRDAPDEAISLDRILTSIESAKKLRLVILDACRDNPFIPKMRRTTATRSIGRGLGYVEPEGGTLIAYSAKHGQLALDGNGENSPFVLSLVKHLVTPGVEINKVFRAIRDDVLRATSRMQEPFLYGSLPNEDFYFKPPQPSATPASTEAPPSASDGSNNKRPEPSSPSNQPSLKRPTKPSSANVSKGSEARPIKKKTAAVPVRSRPTSARNSNGTKLGNCFKFGGQQFCE